jgi:hypothetical protein
MKCFICKYWPLQGAHLCHVMLHMNTLSVLHDFFYGFMCLFILKVMICSCSLFRLSFVVACSVIRSESY